MASSTFSFKDQNGNPVWGLATRISRGKWDTNKAEDERYPDNAGNTSFLEVKKVLPSPLGDSGPGHTIHVNYNGGLNPNWADYEPVSKYFIDIEDPSQIGFDHPIIVKRKGTNPIPVNCPVDYNKQQFTDWFNRIKVGSIVTVANMESMVPELQKCGMLWQNQGLYPVSQWRPRIHQPPIRPDHDSDHNVDCGDFGDVWKLTFRY